MVSNSPLQIGITGGIGSGKSLICRVFGVLGIPVYQADERAKWLMNHHAILQDSIRQQFGSASYHPNGTLNRSYLASQVFNDSDRVSQLNALVHPKVAEDYAEWVLAHAHSRYLLKEAALLYEANSYRLLHYTITVYAPVEVRIRRVQQRDLQRTDLQIRAIIGKQMTEEERQSRADFVIYNDDSQLVLPQILALHERFLREAG